LILLACEKNVKIWETNCYLIRNCPNSLDLSVILFLEPGGGICIIGLPGSIDYIIMNLVASFLSVALVDIPIALNLSSRNLDFF
jgi:hypothetical protein